MNAYPPFASFDPTSVGFFLIRPSPSRIILRPPQVNESAAAFLIPANPGGTLIHGELGERGSVESMAGNIDTHPGGMLAGVRFLSLYGVAGASVARGYHHGPAVLRPYGV